MKKKIKFLICAAIVFSCTAVCKAQQEAAMLVDGTVWVYRNVPTPNTPLIEFFTIYYLSGDTLANGKTYKVLYAKAIVPRNPDLMGHEQYSYLVREEGDKVYTLADEVEYVLYDFDALKNGDSISVYYGDGQYEKRNIVDRSSSVTMEDGSQRTVYKVFYTKSPIGKFCPANMEIIDHIGCRNTLGSLISYYVVPTIAPYTLNPPYSVLNFVVRDGKIIYKDAEDYKDFPWQNYIAGYASGIVQPEKVRTSTGIFNLQGQRIKSMQKGLNIIDGRKVWVR